MQGFFQETDQLTAMRPYSKFAERVEDPYRLPIYIAGAIKKATHGTPGPAYLDLPGDVIQNSWDEDKVIWAPKVISPRKTLSDPADVEAAISALKTAKQPLVIFGKGVNNADAASEMREFVEENKFDLNNKIFVKIKDSINKFLDNIMVNVDRDDVKNNRKALLLKSKEIIDSFFKFSQIGDNAK